MWCFWVLDLGDFSEELRTQSTSWGRLFDVAVIPAEAGIQYELIRLLVKGVACLKSSISARVNIGLC